MAHDGLLTAVSGWAADRLAERGVERIVTATATALTEIADPDVAASPDAAGLTYGSVGLRLVANGNRDGATALFAGSDHLIRAAAERHPILTIRTARAAVSTLEGKPTGWTGITEFGPTVWQLGLELVVEGPAPLPS